MSKLELITQRSHRALYVDVLFALAVMVVASVMLRILI
jgi:hypothetical protein